MTIEVRAAGTVASEGKKVVGYAATFGQVADLGAFKEVIRSGAFSRSLESGSNVKALAFHEHTALLGTTQAGTLKLGEDSHGLAFELTLPDTTHGRDVGELIKRGDIAGCSFGFRVIGENWAGELRELLEVELIEITLTDNPAYSDTSVALRHKKETRPSLARLWLETL